MRPDSTRRPSPGRLVGGNLLLAASYVLLSHLGAQVALVGWYATPVWPPAGVALAALLLFGPRLLPGIALGALAGPLASDSSLFFALMDMSGDSLGAFAAWAALSQARFCRHLRRPRDVMLLVAFGALLTPLISATFGTTALVIEDIVSLGAAPAVFAFWWLGDMMAVLIVTPCLLTWTRPPAGVCTPALSTAHVALLIAVPVLALTAFGGVVPGSLEGAATLALLPVIVAIAWHSGQRETSTAVIAAAGIAVIGTVRGDGPFAGELVQVNLLELLLFLACLALTGLLLAANARRTRTNHPRCTESTVPQVDNNLRSRPVQFSSRSIVVPLLARVQRLRRFFLLS